MLNTEQECLDCFRRQILRTAQMQGCPPDVYQRVAAEMETLLEAHKQTCSPPEIAGLAYRVLAEHSGVKDPYAEIRRDSTRQMLGLYPELRESVRQAEDPLRQAILFAGMGNAIDYGANPDFDLEDSFIHPEIPTHIFEYQSFRTQLQEARSILYLADNAGETVLDRILIEALALPVVYVVKSHPAINDALYEDAIAAGIDQVAEIIESGTFCPGTVLHTCDEDFQTRFREADLIISKGQGNYEALCCEDAPIFFLLKVKCDLISRHIQAPKGSLVFKRAG
ncbi:DUF89 family protein [bacterium]|nr:DUF89 family protein [bacterium]